MKSAPPPDPIAAYDLRAANFAAIYESVSAADVHASFADLVPRASGLALDVGAGSGRDAAWLASLGQEVVAVEPAAGMRREGADAIPTSEYAASTIGCRISLRDAPLGPRL